LEDLAVIGRIILKKIYERDSFGGFVHFFVHFRI
jgi:hypothetical protein